MSYKQKALSGIKWNTSLTIVTAVTGISKTAVVARFIERSDFGLLAIVNMVLGFTALFTDMGLTTAMLHKQDISVKQYSTLYWFNWLLNSALFIVICAVSPVVAIFYKDPRLTHLIILMGLTILISPLGKVFATIKTKALEFGFITKVSILTHVVGLALVVLLAVWGWGIYSLVFSSVVSALLGAIIYSIAGRKECQIVFYLKYREVKEFFNIGLYEMGKQIFDYFSYRIDVLLIGKFFGMESLGIYNLGKELVLWPTKFINPVVNKVATPIFAKIQKDKRALKANYLRILNILSFINFPILALLFILADPVVGFVYGGKYRAVALFVRILSIWGLFAVVGNPAGVLQVATGRTDLGFRWTVIRVICTPIAIIISSYFSVEAVAYSQAILQMVFFFIYWRLLIYPLSEISFREYVEAVTGALICSIVGVMAVAGFNLIYSGNVLFHLISGGGIFALVYLGVTFLGNRKTVGLAQSLLLKKSAS